MKQILIIGSTSYIGTSFQKYAEKNHNRDVSVDFLSVRDDSWKERDFSGYCAILHCAALVHLKSKACPPEAYRKVNCDLAYEVAAKAKKEGVPQFIFLSTMAVYGVEGKIGKTMVIDKNTIANPRSPYGISKLAGEEKISTLSSPDFHLAIVRPPMVYGDDCPGNYQFLKKFILTFRVFPTLENQRSMISIDELCSFFYALIEQEAHGIFHPQNPEYVCTLRMAQEIARQQKSKLHCCCLLNPIVRIGGLFCPAFHKVWGGLVYARSLSSGEKNLNA